jgi:hypothetical protein
MFSPSKIKHRNPNDYLKKKTDLSCSHVIQHERADHYCELLCKNIRSIICQAYNDVVLKCTLSAMKSMFLQTSSPYWQRIEANH